MSIADYAVIVLLITNIVAFAYANVWRNRADNLEIDCARKDAIMTGHLRATDEIMATVADVERYNAWLESHIAHLVRTGHHSSKIAELMMHRRITPEVN